MTTINTIEDFTRVLRENPEWRDEIRRLLLTEELLELPQRFAEYAKVTDLRLGSLEQKVDTLTGEVGTLTGRVDTLTGRVGTLTGRVDTLTYRVDSLRGYALESKLPTRIPPIVSREFDARRVYPIWTPSIAYSKRMREFESKLERAAEDGAITDEDETRVRVTDLILRSQRKADNSTLWFVVEASGVVNYDDITRARRSANVVAKVYEQDAVPVVYGYTIDDEQRELADELGVSVFLDPEGV